MEEEEKGMEEDDTIAGQKIKSVISENEQIKLEM